MWLFFAGCSPTPSASNKILLWHWMTDCHDTFLQLAQRYKQETGIEVTVRLFAPSDSYSQMIIAAAQANVLPDIYGILNTKSIVADFIKAGFEAVVVVTKADIMGEEWLGRKIDAAFIKDLKKLAKTKPITPCGEAGEYHTLVIDGPLFQQRLEITGTQKVLRDGYWFLDIGKAELKDKN